MLALCISQPQFLIAMGLVWSWRIMKYIALLSLHPCCWHGEQRKKHISFSFSLIPTWRMILGCSEMALYSFEVLLSIWKRSQEAQVCLWATKLVPWQVQSRMQGLKLPLMLPPGSLVCEYPRKTILQTPQMGKGVTLLCTSLLVIKNNCMDKKVVSFSL